MDLVYMNANREDIGVLMGYEFDLAFGTDENDFECKVSKDYNVCDLGYYLYMDGTEYGGIIDAIESDTSTNSIIYTGRTWHGILNSKILIPSEGNSHIVFDGDMNSVIGEVIFLIGLSDLFEIPEDDSLIGVHNYKMDRFIGAYDGLKKMLSSVNAKLRIQYLNEKVLLSAIPIVEYKEQDDISSDLLDFKIKETSPTGKVNHLICLGKGEMEDRMVHHLYADDDGNITETQSKTGMDEYVAVYESSSEDDTEKLITGGIERFNELLKQDTIEVMLGIKNDSYDIGDKVTATDDLTGVTATVTIGKKIVSVKNGIVSISANAESEK